MQLLDSVKGLICQFYANNTYNFDSSLFGDVLPVRLIVQMIKNSTAILSCSIAGFFSIIATKCPYIKFFLSW